MLTGVVDVETAIRAIRMGASDYITKPFRLAEVRVTVERVLEKRRLVMENREYRRTLEARVGERTRIVRVWQLLHRFCRRFRGRCFGECSQGFSSHYLASGPAAPSRLHRTSFLPPGIARGHPPMLPTADAL